MTMTPIRRLGTALVALVATVSLAGCAGGGRSGSDNPGAQGPASAAPGPAGAAERVSVNDSSVPDLTAALRANGVSEPGKWAQTLVEYRPYPEDAAGAAAIRDVLVRFQADEETQAGITNAVTP